MFSILRHLDGFVNGLKPAIIEIWQREELESKKLKQRQ